MQALVVTTSARSCWFELARSSLRAAHADAVVAPLLADGRLLARPPVDSVLPQGVAVGPLRYTDLVLAFGERGAAWAALPWILEHHRTRWVPGEPIVVLADTVSTFSPLDELLAPAAGGVSVARALHCDPQTGLAWGGCLPGAIVLSGPDAELLGWWRTRTLAELAGAARAGIVDSVAPAADHVSWLWRDLPIGRAVEATTAPSVRWSAWTAGELTVMAEGDRLTVDDEPAQLVDMEGLDPARPWWFAPPGSEPRRYVSESRGLRSLTHLTTSRLVAAGWSEDATHSIGAVPGSPTTPELRAWYRSLLAPVVDAHLASEAVLSGEHATLPPNPYVTGQVGAFLDLLADGEDSPLTGVSRHADLVMAHRPDLRAGFPAVRWSGRDDFIRWMWTHGLAEHSSSLALLPDLPLPPPRATADDGPLPFGVNLVGYLTGELGLGVAARRMKTALEAAGVPVATVSYDRTSSRRQEASARTLDAPYAFNLLVITPDQLPFFVEDVGEGFLAGHFNIGLWYWETDVLTDRQISSFRWVDEVWGATQYLCEVFARYDCVPVRHVPVPLVFDDPRLVDGDRERLGLDDRFTVLFSFDFLSVVERKNPLGLVDAFCRAFAPTDGARLILKGINGDVFPDELERLLDAIADRPDIDVWDRYLSSRDRLALVASADCYASLHRSEGLGLTMAEAMALGTPVVATAYSGNLDFMDETNSLLVPAREVLIGPGSLYPADGHWSEPDLDVAASHLRRLFEEPELRARLSAAAIGSLERFGVQQVADVASRRLDELGTTA